MTLFLLTPSTVTPLTLDNLHSYQCQVKKAVTDNSSNYSPNEAPNKLSTRQSTKSPTKSVSKLSVHFPSAILAKQYANHLCDQTLVARSYNEVEVSWLPREKINSDYLLQQKFDVMFSRKHVMQGLLPSFNHFYQEVLTFPNYSVYWFSNNVMDNVDLKQYNIGLVSDSQSQSSHQLPIKYLRQSGYQLNELAIHYYSNKGGLLKAFLRGEVDIIPSVKGIPVLSDWPAEHLLLIDDTAPLGSVYVSKQVKPDFICTIQQSFTLLKPVLARLTQEPIHINDCNKLNEIFIEN
ncbi:hypothetical protein [Colwellia echini]|uniref:Solute-binding protein family 3/N-terminal domain-containing protein n=1 Tax=Colwellia echini TaxID=1982103 RepID=A0ABY3MYK1_9GAMM|nr:hypothetical protein [Colwellia echini]TYK66102.1 hypothetical protein CWS31_007495 [Colwellia echini]